MLAQLHMRSAPRCMRSSPTTRTEPPDRQLLRLPRTARAGHAPAEDRLHRVGRSPFTPLGAKGMGEGGGAGIHASARRSRTRCEAREAASCTDSHNPRSGSRSCRDPEATARMCRSRPDEGRGERTILEAPARRCLGVLNDPAEMAKLMPGVEDSRWRTTALVGEGQGPARARRPEDRASNFEKLEEREPELAECGRRARAWGPSCSMETHFELAEQATATSMALGGGRQRPRPGRHDGPARAPADREPAGREGA